MKSEYLVLGVPGNASAEDIEEAFNKAKNYYSPSRMAEDAQTVDKFIEVRKAYHVLRDPASRASHDRKLNSAQLVQASAKHSVQQIRQETEPTSSLVRTLQVMTAVFAVIFAAGFYISSKKEAARIEQAAQELAIKKLAAEEAAKEEQTRASENMHKAQAAKIERQEQQFQQEQQLRQDQRFRQESLGAIARARSAETQRAYQERQAEQAEQREAQRKEYEIKMREQNAVREAQQRLASDKARIRELCYQNYRRPDC
jgi:curved DNA-binding protein CbpA